MTKEEGSVQLTAASWILRGACKVSVTSLTQAGLAGKLHITQFAGSSHSEGKSLSVRKVQSAQPSQGRSTRSYCLGIQAGFAWDGSAQSPNPNRELVTSVSYTARVPGR